MWARETGKSAEALTESANGNEPTSPSSQDRARNAATAAAEKTQQCNSFKSRVDGFISQQRVGGSNNAMEQLHRQRQQIEKSAGDAGC
jgi:hypothetical protein